MTSQNLINSEEYPVYVSRIDCGVVGCNELAYDYETDGHDWYKDHPKCTCVFLCKYHYDHY